MTRSRFSTPYFRRSPRPSAVAEVERRGGAVRFRSIRRGNRVLTVAVTARPGPGGGRTVVTAARRVGLGSLASRAGGRRRRKGARRSGARDARGRFRRATAGAVSRRKNPGTHARAPAERRSRGDSF